MWHWCTLCTLNSHCPSTWSRRVKNRWPVVTTGGQPASLSGWAAEPLLEGEILQQTSASAHRRLVVRKEGQTNIAIQCHTLHHYMSHHVTKSTNPTSFCTFCTKPANCTTAAVLPFSGLEQENQVLMFSWKLLGRYHRNSFSACAGSGLPSWHGRAMPEADQLVPWWQVWGKK